MFIIANFPTNLGLESHNSNGYDMTRKLQFLE